MRFPLMSYSVNLPSTLLLLTHWNQLTPSVPYVLLFICISLSLSLSLWAHVFDLQVYTSALKLLRSMVSTLSPIFLFSSPFMTISQVLWWLKLFHCLCWRKVISTFFMVLLKLLFSCQLQKQCQYSKHYPLLVLHRVSFYFILEKVSLLNLFNLIALCAFEHF